MATFVKLYIDVPTIFCWDIPCERMAVGDSPPDKEERAPVLGQSGRAVAGGQSIFDTAGDCQEREGWRGENVFACVMWLPCVVEGFDSHINRDKIPFDLTL